jgi:hypothetical protein
MSAATKKRRSRTRRHSRQTTSRDTAPQAAPDDAADDKQTPVQWIGSTDSPRRSNHFNDEERQQLKTARELYLEIRKTSDADAKTSPAALMSN